MRCMMARKGRKFELDYEWLYKLDINKYTITSPAMLYDKTTSSHCWLKNCGWYNMVKCNIYIKGAYGSLFCCNKGSDIIL